MRTILFFVFALTIVFGAVLIVRTRIGQSPVPITALSDDVATTTNTADITQNGVSSENSAKLGDITSPYKLSCVSKDVTSIEINWTPPPVNSDYAATSAKYTLELFWSQFASGPWTSFGIKPAGSGIYRHKGLKSNAQYWYKLDAVYAPSKTISAKTAVPCRTADPMGEAPTNLKTFANSDSIIYLNWKDNAVRKTPYQFQVQRIKLDMKQSADFTAASTGANSTSLSSKNDTTLAPYYARFQRSLSPAFTNPKYVIGSSYEPYTAGLPAGQAGSFTANPNPFSSGDTRLDEATTYYYRAQVCAAIPNISSMYTEQTGAVEVNSSKPNPSCGPYTAAEIKATTWPNAPTEATTTDVTATSIRVSWKDNSLKDTRYEVFRDGISVKKFEGSYSTKGAQTGSMEFTDIGLSPGTAYVYTIKAYYDVAEGDYVYSSAVINQMTDFLVTVTKTGDGQGTVTSNPVGINCGTACAKFDAGVKVTLTATASSSDYKFAGWGGTCSGASATSTTCEVSGNAAVTAQFIQKYYTVSVSKEPSAVVGTVTDSKTIVCGSVCSASSEWGSAVTLTAAPEAGYVFRDWISGNSCGGLTNPVCSFTVSGTTQITARFADTLSTLSFLFMPSGANGNKVTTRVLSGQGSGSETTCTDSSAPCATDYYSGAQIRLTAIPASSYVFYGWDGGECNGQSSNVCNTQIWKDTTIKATFTRRTSGIETKQISILIPQLSPLINQISNDIKIPANSNVLASVYGSVFKKPVKAISEIYRDGFAVISAKLFEFKEFMKNLFTAHGQTISETYANYFVTLGRLAPNYVPYYIDDTLTPDTVYMYRVRLRYPDGTFTNWTNVSATKTLARPVTRDNSVSRAICTSNNFCNLSVKLYKGTSEKSEKQCNVNADCGDVGRPDKFSNE